VYELGGILRNDAISSFELGFVEEFELAPNQRVVENVLPIQGDGFYHDTDLGPRSGRTGRDWLLKPDDAIQILFACDSERPATNPSGLVRRVGIGGETTLKPSFEVQREHLQLPQVHVPFYITGEAFEILMQESQAPRRSIFLSEALARLCLVHQPLMEDEPRVPPIAGHP
jgi:hypothetical protein